MSEQKYGLGSGSSDNKSISEDNHYLFISPIIDMRFTKYFHFVVLPSYGYLISGSENSTITNRNSNSSGNVVIFDSSYNSTYAVNQQIFRIALGIEGYIPIYKNWWLILSQRYNLIQRGTISESLNFDIRNGKTIQPGFITAQVGILYHFNKKGKE
jgi:hypothetical protein